LILTHYNVYDSTDEELKILIDVVTFKFPQSFIGVGKVNCETNLTDIEKDKLIKYLRENVD